MSERISKLGDMYRWRGVVWTPVTARKATKCWLSGKDILPGDVILSPLTNNGNRMRRVIPAEMEAALATISEGT